MALSFPTAANNATYAKIILDAVGAADFKPVYAPVTSSYKGHTATFYVTADAITVDGFRAGMGARLMQQVADVLGCTLLTARLSDLCFMQRAAEIDPIGLGALHESTQTMMNIATMRKESAAINAALAKVGYTTGLIFGPGKPWIIDNHLGDAASHGKCENYGQYMRVPPGTSIGVGLKTAATVTDSFNLPKMHAGDKFSVIQGYWWPPFHGVGGPDYAGDQADYSEMAWLLKRYCEVDGAPRDTVDVMRDPELCGLVTHDGKPLLIVRQPGVPIASCAIGTGAPGVGGPIDDGSDGKSACPIRDLVRPPTFPLAQNPPTGTIPSSKGDASVVGPLLAAGAAAFVTVAAGWWWLKSRHRKAA